LRQGAPADGDPGGVRGDGRTPSDQGAPAPLTVTARPTGPASSAGPVRRCFPPAGSSAAGCPAGRAASGGCRPVLSPVPPSPGPTATTSRGTPRGPGPGCTTRSPAPGTSPSAPP